MNFKSAQTSLTPRMHNMQFQLVNLKTTSTTLLPGVAIKNDELRQAAHALSLFDTFTKGIIQITRIN